MSYIPLTTRGVILCVFAIVLFLGPARNEADLIATVVSISLFFLIILLIVLCYTNRTLIEKSLIPLQISALEGHMADGHGETLLHSGRPEQLLYRIPKLFLLPFFEIRAQLHFLPEDIALPTHRFRGLARKDTLISEEITFPHRGIWQASYTTLAIGDWLGLCQAKWRLGVSKDTPTFKVYPPQINTANLPILSSASRPGDTLLDTEEAQGDYFDLKQYHPADGARKIVWKVYAKARKLISRHPEKAVTPEGQVVVFCVANRAEDDVCGAALDFLHRAEEAELQPVFSCEGANIEEMVHSKKKAADLLIESVWDSEQSTADSLCNQLHQLYERLLKDPHVNIQRVFIFVSLNRLTSAAWADAYIRMGELLKRNNIEPLFCTGRLNNQPKEARGGPFSSRLKKLLVSTPSDQLRHNPTFALEFLKKCTAKTWGVYYWDSNRK